MKIETERLLLRKFEISDADAVLRFAADPEVTRYTGDAGVVKTLEDAKEIITNTWHKDYEKYDYGRLALVTKETEEVIGFCGLKYLTDFQKTDLGYRMLPEYWGRGYATESSRAIISYAKENMDLTEIIAMAEVNNLGSEKVLLKLGFSEIDKIVIYGLSAKLFELKLRG